MVKPITPVWYGPLHRHPERTPTHCLLRLPLLGVAFLRWGVGSTVTPSSSESSRGHTPRLKIWTTCLHNCLSPPLQWECVRAGSMRCLHFTRLGNRLRTGSKDSSKQNQTLDQLHRSKCSQKNGLEGHAEGADLGQGQYALCCCYPPLDADPQLNVLGSSLAHATPLNHVSWKWGQ